MEKIDTSVVNDDGSHPLHKVALRQRGCFSKRLISLKDAAGLFRILGSYFLAFCPLDL